MQHYKTYFLLFTAVIFLAIYNEWFFSISILTKGDWPYLNAETLNQIRINYFSLWLNDQNFGRILIDVAQAPTYSLAGALSLYLNLSWASIERLLYFLPTLIIGSFGIYKLIYSIYKNYLIAVLGVIIFGFNTYSITLQTGHFTLAVAFAIAPLVVYFFIRSLETGTLFDSALCFFTLFILSSYEPRAAYIVMFILVLYFAYYFITNNSDNIYSKKSKLINTFIGGVIFILLNVYWLLGLSSINTNFNNESILSRSLWGSEYYDLNSAITLFHPWWTGEEISVFVKQDVPLLFYFIPIAAILGMYFGRKNKIVVFFGLLACIGILLTKQQAPPFTDLYEWLFNNFPGFNAFREASKFYFLIAISYTILICSFVNWIILSLSVKRIIKVSVYLAIIILFIQNSVPIINKNIDSLFVARSIPEDYNKLNDYLLKKESFSYVLWVPISSRWGTYTENTPKLDLITLNSTDWKKFKNNEYLLKDIENEAMDVLKKNYSNELLSNASIEYIVLPMNDKANNDDFFVHYGGKNNSEIRNWYSQQLNLHGGFEKIEINAKEVELFKNKNYKQYIRSFNSLVSYNSIKNLEEKYDFTSDKLNLPFNFVINKETYSYPAIGITNLFLDNDSINIINGKIIDTLPNIGSLYTNTKSLALQYTYLNGVLEFSYVYDPSLYIDKKLVDDIYKKSTVINTIKADTNSVYLAAQGPKIQTLNLSSTSKTIGNAELPTKIQKFSDENIIKNHSFEDGSWQDKVGDCNNYDSNPILDMSLAPLATNGSLSLELAAIRHNACISQDNIPVEGGENYIFSFDAQGTNEAGYFIKFNDANNTSTSNRIPIDEFSWNNYSLQISIPADATSAELFIYSYQSDGVKGNVARYDNVRLSKIEDVLLIPAVSGNAYEKQELEFSSSSEFSFFDSNTKFNNQIINHSLENGLWQQKVGDCHNYDSNPVIGMDLVNTSSEGLYSLELTATRHNACTGPKKISVVGGKEYLLSFDFQNDNKNQAGYYLGFNDVEITAFSKIFGRDDFKADGWNNFTTRVKVPIDATTASLNVYAYQSDGKTKNSVRYDNFKFIELPDINNRYYLVTNPPVVLTEPAEVTFKNIHPTRKNVSIKSASTPFYLAMSEKYHPDWHLHFNNSNDDGFFEKKMPWNSVDSLATTEHFELNGFINGWYIDINQYCKEQSLCTRNPDGSYNMELVVEFSPQRWFNLGLIISGSTFISCLGYLLYCFFRRRKQITATDEV